MGTGKAHTFNDMAKAVLDFFGSGKLVYVPFPEVLKGKYQSYTQADTTKLILTCYDGGFTDFAEAVKEYCGVLQASDGYYR